MVGKNTDKFGTSFTVSVDLIGDGVTTGISASDRYKTVKALVDKKVKPGKFSKPGHIFPLKSLKGGVLRRAGHTEASVDLARLSGHMPAGVICEIMNDDGTMARIPDLIEFSKKHSIKIGRIVDLISHRRNKDKFIKKSYDSEINLDSGGKFNIKIYQSLYDGTEQIVLTKGDVSDGNPIMVRVHVTDYFDNLFGDYGSDDASLHKAIKIIEKENRGVIILIRDTGKSIINNLITNQSNSDKRIQNTSDELRIYGMGAQILSEIGIKKMILLTNTEWKFIGLDAFDIEIIETKFLNTIND